MDPGPDEAAAAAAPALPRGAVAWASAAAGAAGLEPDGGDAAEWAEPPDAGVVGVGVGAVWPLSRASAAAIT